MNRATKRWASKVSAVLLMGMGSANAQWVPNPPDPGGPTAAANQMYTLTDLYNRLDTGAAGTKATTFTEPAAGPTTQSTKTIDDVMAKMPAVDAANGAAVSDVLAGKKFWGLLSGGGWGLKTGTATVGTNVTGSDGQ